MASRARRTRSSCAPSRSATALWRASWASPRGGDRAPAGRAARDPRRDRAGARSEADRTRAPRLGAGELMATHIGVRFLRYARDSRLLGPMAPHHAACRRARQRLAKASVLSAVCGFAPDAALEERLQGSHRWSSPRDSSPAMTRQHRTPGRGGSDTSAALSRGPSGAPNGWRSGPTSRACFSANPRATPTARLLRALHYDEAQEIATSGAKVLHPRCILPARQYHIPLHVYATRRRIWKHGASVPRATAARSEGGVQPARASRSFRWKPRHCGTGRLPRRCLSGVPSARHVGRLVSTSETSVTVSLDPAANSLDNTRLPSWSPAWRVCAAVQVIGPCASVSLVGRTSARSCTSSEAPSILRGTEKVRGETT